nr:ankyrin repeat domain-containing protein [Nitrospiraceae bacterium]
LVMTSTGFAGQLEDKLINAAKNGDVNGVRAALDKGAKIDEATDTGGSALVQAAEYGHADVVKLLLDKGANIEAKDYCNGTALMDAAGNGDVEVVKLLLDKGANMEAKNCFGGQTALDLAAGDGHVDVVKLLLDKGADIEEKDDLGDTALTWAAMGVGGRSDVVKLLLEKGANIEVTDKNGYTALMYAADGGHADVVKLLLDKGANIEATDKDGYTALMKAADEGYMDAAKLLLERTDNSEAKTLMQAAYDGNVDVIKQLFREGAVEATGKDGWAAVMLAANNGHADVLSVLFERGAHCVSQLNDTAREKICRLAPEMSPLLKVPARAKREFIKGNTFIRKGKDASAAQKAIDSYKKALCLAPWWGPAYYNLGLAYEAAGAANDDYRENDYYQKAVKAMNYFLLTKPGEPWRDQAQKEIEKIKKRMVKWE